jgi:hypothetical protein
LSAFCLIAIVTLLVAESSTHGQEDEEVSQQLQYQLMDMENELSILSDILDLDENVSQDISGALTDNAKQAAKRVEDKANSDTSFYSPNLDEQFQEEIWKKTKELINDEQRVKLASYVEDYRKIRNLHNQYGQHCLIKFLDDYLCLNPQQKENLHTGFSKDWDSYRNSDCIWLLMGIQRANVRLLDSLDRKLLESNLRADQLELLDSLEEFKTSYSNFLAKAMEEGDNWAAKELSQHCLKLTQLKIAELKASCKISDEQARKLAFAFKGASAEVVREWKAWANMMADTETSPTLKEVRTMEMGMKPLLYQCTSQTVWTRAIENTLTESQREKFSELEKGRADDCEKQMIIYVSLFLFNRENRLRLSHEQSLAFVEMLTENVSADSGGDGWGVSLAIIRIDDAEFQRALTDEQWAKVKPILDQQRAMLAAMEEDKD